MNSRRIGDIFYLVTCILAGAVAILGLIGAVWIGGGLLPEMGALGVASLIWLIGRCVRYAFSIGSNS
jgi:hypothetical protein